MFAGGLADMTPGDIVEIAIETGQDHRALRNARDRVEKLGRRRIGARRSKRDNGGVVARAFQMFDLRREQRSLTLSPVNHAALFENERPLPQGDAQKSRGNGPILVEGFAGQAIDRGWIRILDDEFVDQGAKLLGQRGGVGGRFLRPILGHYDAISEHRLTAMAAHSRTARHD